MINYSRRARSAYGRLFRPYNDCDVYVEDTSIVGVHERLINKALLGKGHVQRVIPLGNRREVLEAAKVDITGGGRPRLYVVDGDLDLLARGRNPKYPHLYRLQVYEIENLLLELTRLEDYVAVACPKLARGVALARVDVPGLLSEIDQLLPSYFVVLAVARRLKIKGPIFKLNPPSVSRQSGGHYVGPSAARLRTRLRQLISEMIARVGLARYRRELLVVRTIQARRRLRGVGLVPGKKFILWYLNQRILEAGGDTLPTHIIASMLSTTCTFALERGYYRRVRNLL